jgi:quercetin dioxygenase-like cupin family protein
MKRWITSAALVLAVGSKLPAQADGLVAFPDTYRVQFENEWVRVVRVRLAAGASLGMHTHPAGFMFHVYLNDAESIWFNHDGAPHEIQRPPVAARSYRIGTATPETHAVVNPSAGASDFMRVEYKTRGGESSRRRVGAGLLRDTTAAVVEHTGEQSRVTRVTIAAGASQEFATAAGQPALIIMVTDGRVAADSSGREETLKVGAERFIGAGSRVVIRNAGTTAVQMLRFDFLTPPPTF